MKKFLLVATVVKAHINTFHIPTLKMMKDKGYEVHVASHNDYDDPADMYIPHCDKFIEIPFERSPLKLNNIKSYQKLKELFKKENYDIIHCHTPVGGALTRLAAKETRKNGTKILYTAHGFHFYKGAPIKNWLLFYTAERILAKYTDTLITINKEDYNTAQKFNVQKKYYVPGVGIDLDNYSNKINTKNAGLTEHLKINNSDFILFSTGELNRNKNHEVVIRAIAQLNNPSIHYIIAGDGPLYEYLSNLAKELKVYNQVHLLGYRNDIAKILNVSDVFIFPSIREGLSVSLMEAMASGLPVIASDIRGNSDLIDNHRGGYLCEIHDVSMYARKIEYLKENHVMNDLLGTYNQKKIKKFSISQINKKMEKIYLEVF